MSSVASVRASFAASAAQPTGVRLITIDRPGIGESTRRRGRFVGDWADDVRAAAEAIPQARLELVPDAGDFLVIEHGHEVFTRLLESTSG